MKEEYLEGEEIIVEVRVDEIYLPPMKQVERLALRATIGDETQTTAFYHGIARDDKQKGRMFELELKLYMSCAICHKNPKVVLSIIDQSGHEIASNDIELWRITKAEQGIYDLTKEDSLFKSKLHLRFQSIVAQVQLRVISMTPGGNAEELQSRDVRSSVPDDDEAGNTNDSSPLHWRLHNKIKKKWKKKPSLVVATREPIAEDTDTQWMNDLMGSMWPQIDQAIEKMVRETVGPMIKESVPGVLHVSVQNFSMGQHAPSIDNVKIYEVAEGLEVRIFMSKDSPVDITIHTAIANIDVRRIYFQAEQVIRLTPLLDEITEDTRITRRTSSGSATASWR